MRYAILYTKHPVTPIQLNPWFPLRDTAGGTDQEPSPQTSPYLDTLNLGKVILFLMNKVNFSASDSRAGLKNTSVDMGPSLGSPDSRESPIWWKFTQTGTSRQKNGGLIPSLSGLSQLRLSWPHPIEPQLGLLHTKCSWGGNEGNVIPYLGTW